MGIGSSERLKLAIVQGIGQACLVSGFIQC